MKPVQPCLRGMSALRPRKRTTPAAVLPTEATEQERLFVLVAQNRAKLPALDLLFAIPNGGFRHKATAAAMSRQGVKAGVSDCFLPVRRGAFGGLWLELKRQAGGKVSPAQSAWLQRMEQEGYAVLVACGCEEAWAGILRYLGLEGAK